MQLQVNILKKHLDNSLQEDYGINGDITSCALIGEEQSVNFAIRAREEIILCGTEIAKYYLDEYSSAEYEVYYKDSDFVEKGSAIISGKVLAREILMIERVMLNYLQHLSGISTYTNAFVRKIQNTKSKIFDTRKTLPLYRGLQKYAVRCGGGYNHRLCLDSSILIKDNHIAICGSITNAIKKAKKQNSHYGKIEIECDTLEQVKEAIYEEVDIIMLDNMTLEQTKEAKKIIDGKAIIDVSGNVSLDTVGGIAKAGVDMISVGRITHSAPASDIGLDIL